MSFSEYTVHFVQTIQEAIHVEQQVVYVNAFNEFDAIEKASNILPDPQNWECIEVNEV